MINFGATQAQPVSADFHYLGLRIGLRMVAHQRRSATLVSTDFLWGKTVCSGAGLRMVALISGVFL
jgi:hypothetical protein